MGLCGSQATSTTYIPPSIRRSTERSRSLSKHPFQCGISVCLLLPVKRVGKALVGRRRGCQSPATPSKWIAQHRAQHSQYLTFLHSDDNALNWIPSDPKDCPSDIVIDKKTLERQGGWWDGYENDERFKKDEDSLAEKLAECRWAVLRKPKLPEPTFEDVDYEPASGERLFERFRESGLQVIVKIASIELTPEKPYFHPGSWHVEGQLNERIAATALYYVDSKNITPTKLSFRMQTSSYLQDGDGGGFDVGQDQYHWLESAYGTNFGCGNSPCLQNYGSVETKEKRLLAFPNVL
jgi:hypothetical protein